MKLSTILIPVFGILALAAAVPDDTDAPELPAEVPVIDEAVEQQRPYCRNPQANRFCPWRCHCRRHGHERRIWCNAPPHWDRFCRQHCRCGW